jgi:hypothetical protein
MILERLGLSGREEVRWWDSACATTGTAGSPRADPAAGGIVIRDGDRVGRVAAFWTDRVAMGPPGGPADTYLDRKPNGSWSGAAGGMDPFEGPRYRS